MPLKPNENFHDYKRRVIDIKSESFCGAKWYNATIWLGSGQTTSCHHPPAHRIPLDEVATNPKVIHNTQKKKMEREQMQRGERPSGCDYCWKIEDLNSDAISDRVYKTMRYTDQDLARAYSTPASEDHDLRTLEIAFDRTCQFACSYCNPAFSTTWVKDIKKNGPYNNLISDGRNHFTHSHDNSQLYDYTETNPYIEAFFKWWESDLHRTLYELRITGGEPLMSGHTWKLFDWFRDNPNRSQTRLAINTNLGFDRDVLDRMMDNTQGLELTLFTSNETVGTHAEYIRDGLKWNQWCSNMEYLLSQERVRRITLMCTINALCLDKLTDFLELIIKWKQQYKTYEKNRLTISLNILRFPSFQGLLVLPEEIRRHYRDKLVEWYDQYRDQTILDDFEKHNVTRLIDYLGLATVPHGENFNKEQATQDFKNFYEQYDQRRGKNFRETFVGPIGDWYDTI